MLSHSLAKEFYKSFQDHTTEEPIILMCPYYTSPGPRQAKEQCFSLLYSEDTNGRPFCSARWLLLTLFLNTGEDWSLRHPLGCLRAVKKLLMEIIMNLLLRRERCLIHWTCLLWGITLSFYSLILIGFPSIRQHTDIFCTTHCYLTSVGTNCSQRTGIKSIIHTFRLRN